MSNQRFRAALAAARLTQAALAEAVGVDPKSVERWITQERVPHARTRSKITDLLRQEETYLWPSLLEGVRAKSATESEQIQVWPTRNDVPAEVWRSLLAETREQLDVLVFAGSFLFESHDFVETVRGKAAAGANVRILVGEPESEAIRIRSREEGRPAIADRCRSSIEYLSVLNDQAGVHIRTHATTLYASLFRFDESMLITHHTFGSFASHSPVTHLRRLPGGQLFDFYARSFERVWPTGVSVT